MARRLTAGAAGLGTLLIAAGMAFGQGAKPQEQPLAGPPVRNERPAHLQDRFTEGRMDGRGPMVERPIPMRAYLGIIAKMRGEEAPEAIRLTEAQERAVAAVIEEFRAASRAAQPRPRVEPRRQGEDAPPPPPPAEARRPAPRPQDFQVKIWAALNEPQQAFLEKEIAALRAQADKEMGEAYVQRELARRRGAQPAAAPQPAPEPAPAARERIRRIAERLQQLPPEEREQILRRLEQELDRRLQAGEPPRPERRRTREGAPPPQNNPRPPRTGG